MMKNILNGFKKRSHFIYVSSKLFPITMNPVNYRFCLLFKHGLGNGKIKLSDVKLPMPDQQFEPDNFEENSEKNYLFLQADGTVSQEKPDKDCIILAQLTQKINDDQILGIRTRPELWVVILCRVLIVLQGIAIFKYLHLDSRFEKKHLVEEMIKKTNSQK